MLRSVSLFQRSNRNLVDQVIAPAVPMERTGRADRRAPRQDVLVGELTSTAATPPVESAFAALRAHARALGIDDVAGLQPTECGEWNGLQLVRFQQAFAGIPVYGAEVLVGCDETGAARFILSDWNAEAWEFLHGRMTRDVTVAQALDIALADLGVEIRDLTGVLQPGVVVYPTSEGPRMCWHLLSGCVSPLGDWRHFVDVSDGTIRDSTNALRFAFPPRDHATHAGRPAAGSRTETLPHRPAHEAQVEGHAGSPARAHGGFPLRQAPHTLLRLAADTQRRYLRLGYRAAVPAEASSRCPAPPHRVPEIYLADGYDNSFYSPLRGWVVLGAGSYPENPWGTRGLWEDPFVVSHEIGHAVVERTRPGIVGTEGAALHEGWADYFAASFLGETGPRHAVLACSGPGVARDMGLAPQAAPSDPHGRGRRWAACCWRLRESAGADVADRILFGGLTLMTSAFPTMRSAAERLAIADRIAFDGAHEREIAEAFSACRP